MLAACGTQYPPIKTALDPWSAAPANRYETWRPILTPRSPRPSAPTHHGLTDPARTYGLADLIDLGLRANPATRLAWEDSRAAAANLGLAEASWLPVLTARVLAHDQRESFPATSYVYSIRGTEVAPMFRLTWTLFDLARPAAIGQAQGRLLAANFAFNRTLQQVAYEVQRAFYAFNAARARVVAAAVTLRQTDVNAEAVQLRLARGLATRPDLLLAVEDRARAAYELAAAQGEVLNTKASLAERLGISPQEPLTTVELDAIPLPADIEPSAEGIIDRALAHRPDLQARLAEIRSQDAAINKARAAYWPTLGVQAVGGWDRWNYRTIAGATGAGSAIEPAYSLGLVFNWNLFDGFARANEVKRATAAREAAQAQFDALQLQVIREVWQAYASLKTAIRKREFALALLKAADEAYAAARETYANGLSTILELLMAERNLANARLTEVDSRTGLLQAAAALVYTAGSEGEDSPVEATPRTHPEPLPAQAQEGVNDDQPGVSLALGRPQTIGPRPYPSR